MSYGQLATEVYDIDKPVGHSFGDVEFYLERLQTCSGRVLEAAVGSGRVLIPLLESGLLVDGIDNSPEMLTSCRQRCEERGLNPTLYEGQLEDFSLPITYDAIILPAGSFLLLDKREESISGLKGFRRHLNPGGRLILDIFLQTDFDTKSVSIKTWTVSKDELITMETKIVEVDFLNQHTVSHLKYEKWFQGKLVQSELQVFPLRWYGIEEFKMLLQNIGLSDITVYVDYTHGKKASGSNHTFTFEARC